MLISESLRSVSLYPIPPATIKCIMSECGLLDEDVNQNIMQSASYKRAKAKVYLFLADAPNVSEGGANYSLTDNERNSLRRQAESLLADVGDSQGEYGYIGEDFFQN